VLAQRKLTAAAAKSARGDGVATCRVDFSHRSEGSGLGGAAAAGARAAESASSASSGGGVGSGLRPKLGPPVLMVAGGFDGSVLQQCEVYDSSQRSWTSISPLCGPRCSAAVCALSNSRVLVAGGTDGKDLLTSLELYDPEVESWRRLPMVMSNPRRGLRAVFCPGPPARNNLNDTTRQTHMVLLLGGETALGEVLSTCPRP
jgi:hypothetical protein